VGYNNFINLVQFSVDGGHVYKTYFFESFHVRLSSKFLKNNNMSKTKFLSKFNKVVYKNTEFHADFKSIEKVVKNAPKQK
jgi:hypothetical protein